MNGKLKTGGFKNVWQPNVNLEEANGELLNPSSFLNPSARVWNSFRFYAIIYLLQ